MLKDKRFQNILSVTLIMTGCAGTPDTDDFVSEGGTSPDPSAVLAGAVHYRGPRPTCRYEGGKPVEAQGLVVMTLFEYDNPPPPEGNATTAVSFATVSAKRLFPNLDVCLPEKPKASDLADIVNATATFDWSAVPLGATCDEDGKTKGEDYRLHAFFDRDQDFHPLFGVRSQATRGDVAGAAYVDPQAKKLEVARIEVGHASKHPNGQRVDNIVVTVNELIHTERPVFRVSREAQPLSSETALPLGMLFGELSARTEAYKAALSEDNFAIELIPEADRARYAAALRAAGFSLDYDPAGYSWHRENIDANRDGQVDEHPVMRGIPYTTPALFLERARTPAEQSAGVPPVVLLGVSMDVGEINDSLTLPMLIAPVGVMRLPNAATGGACDIPMLSPANGDVVFDNVGAAFECQELATGDYGLTVLHGVQGGALLSNTTARDRFDFPIDGACAGGAGTSCARNSYTAWTIPNDLGPLDTEYTVDPIDQLHDADNPNEALWVDEQGPEGRYVVNDPNPDNDPKRGCEAFPVPAISCDCCGSLTDLCEQKLPLCKHDKRGVAVVETDKQGHLACLPFALPKSCCDGTCIKSASETLPSAEWCEP